MCQEPEAGRLRCRPAGRRANRPWSTECEKREGGRPIGNGMSLRRKSLHFYFIGNGKPLRLLKGRVAQFEFIHFFSCCRMKNELGWGRKQTWRRGDLLGGH